VIGTCASVGIAIMNFAKNFPKKYDYFYSRWFVMGYNETRYVIRINEGKIVPVLIGLSTTP
jgi:hypothetical protein